MFVHTFFLVYGYNFAFIPLHNGSKGPDRCMQIRFSAVFLIFCDGGEEDLSVPMCIFLL